ncbi:MAG TPA: HNH endonuclease, partial [Corynebacterium stationis]|nr:HNH endonuclease [Corynebacterium stationis]
MALTSQAIAILKDMSKRSPYDMASDGMARKTAKNFTQLSDVLFDPTDSPRLQRESVALAEERGLSLDYLEMVEKHARKLKKRGTAWRLRAELIAFEGTFEEV